MDVKRWNRVGKHIEKLEFDSAIAELETELAAEGHAEFQPLIDEDFSEPPADTRGFINELLDAWKTEGKIAAIYLEMNGFDLNTDEWYFDAFGFEKDGGHDDNEWLCDWQHDSEEDTWLLTGMEGAQKLFEWYHGEEKYEEKKYEAAYDIAMLIVMVKYVRYIGRVLASGPLSANVTVYATAHEFDIIARFPAK